MIDQLVETLRSTGLEPTAEEIADIIWLSNHIDSDVVQRRGLLLDGPRTDAPIDNLQNKKEGTSGSGSSGRSMPEPDPTPSTTEEDFTQTDAGGADLYPDQQSEAKFNVPGVAARRFRSPAVVGLAEPLALARSLRPLHRRVDSGTKMRLDEEATVRAIADEGVWLPRLQPAPERWLDVVLVVDEWSSMAIWHQTALDVRRLLVQLGAFRSIELWGIGYGSETNEPTLHAGIHIDPTERRTRHARELPDPQGRRLILMLTDCIAPAWYDGRMTNLLAQATQTQGIFAILQLLPQHLWRRTGLANFPQVHLRSQLPGTPNQLLEIGPPDRYLFDARPVGLTIPVITLAPESLAGWARLVAGTGGQWVPGIVFPFVKSTARRGSIDQAIADVSHQEISDPDAVNAELVSPHQLTAQQYLNHFLQTASPTTRELAGYLAAVPLNFPIMRLVQARMLPRSRQTHLAEVFLSGMLVRKTPLNKHVHPNEIEYDFVDGVRELLLDTVGLSNTRTVLYSISDYVNERSGGQFDFQALLADPTAVGEFVLDTKTRPFATVAAVVLRRMGGSYEQLATRLNSLLSTAIQDNERIEEPPSSSRTNEEGKAIDAVLNEGTHFDISNDSILSTMSKDKDKEKKWGEALQEVLNCLKTVVNGGSFSTGTHPIFQCSLLLLKGETLPLNMQKQEPSLRGLMLWGLDGIKPRSRHNFEWRKYQAIKQFYLYPDAGIGATKLASSLAEELGYEYESSLFDALSTARMKMGEYLARELANSANVKARRLQIIQERYKFVEKDAQLLLHFMQIFELPVKRQVALEIVKPLIGKNAPSALNFLTDVGLLVESKKEGDLVSIHPEVKRYLYEQILTLPCSEDDDSRQQTVLIEGHKHAADFYATHREHMSALYHLIESRQFDKAVTLLEAVGTQLIEYGNRKKLFAYLQNLDTQMLEPEVRVRLSLIYGEILVLAGDINLALTFYSRAASSEVIYYEATAHHRIAKAHLTKDVNLTIAHLERACEILESLHQQSHESANLLVDVYTDLAYVRTQDQPDIKEAKAILMQSEHLIKYLDSERMGRILGASARVAESEDDMPKYVALSLKAYPHAIQSNNKELLFIVAHNLGLGYIWTGEIEKGLEHLREALQAAEEIDAQRWVALSCKSIGNGYFFDKKFLEAIRSYKSAERIYQTIGNQIDLGYLYHDMAEAYAELMFRSEEDNDST